MSIYTEIQNTTSTSDLDNIVDSEMRSRDVDLASSLSWGEQADRFNDALDGNPPNSGGLVELVNILRAAETKWFELEGQS